MPKSMFIGPGKTTLKLYLVCRTRSPRLDTTEHNHMLQGLQGNNKKKKARVQPVAGVFFGGNKRRSGAGEEDREEVGIGSVAPHATSVSLNTSVYI